MSARARVFIAAMLVAGTALSAWALRELIFSTDDAYHLGLLLVAITLGSWAQIRFVEGPTATSSYNLSLVVYAFTFVVLGAPAAIVVSVVACLVDWLWHRYAWFIQAFNIAALAVSLGAAGLVFQVVTGGQGLLESRGTAGLLLAGGTFVLVNHVVVGVVIWLTRGEGFAESGIFGALTLAIDGTLIFIGMGAALLWLVSPSAAVIAAIPLYLLSVTLKVPSLERRATTDPKTGLFNARYFQETLQRELSRANRFDRPLTVVMGDLDLLRNVNNAHGHLAGDQVLLEVARILTESVRDYDVVSRFGGEEFTILMTETTLEEAMPHIEALRERIAAAGVRVAGAESPVIHVTMSFGLAERVGGHDTPGQIIERADRALYRAKQEGRNRMCALSRDECGGEEWYDAPPDRGAVPTAHPAFVEAALALDRPAAGQEAGGSPSTNGGVLGGATARESDARAKESGPAARGEVLQPVGPAPRRNLLLFIGAVASSAALAFALTLTLPAEVDAPGLLTFAVICLLAESFAIDIDVRETSVSAAAAPFIAGALLFGPAGVLALGSIMSLAALLKHHSRPDRFVFNTSTHVLAGLAIIWLVRLMGVPLDEMALWELAGMTLASSMVYYVVTTCLVSGAIALATGPSIARTWRERFGRLGLYYLLLGLVAYALSFGYVSLGIQGVLVILIPLLAIGMVQKHYADRVRGMMDRLHVAGAEARDRADQVARLNEDLLLTLSRAVDVRETHFAGHSRRVAHCATLVAEELGLPREQRRLVREAGLLHDVGKLGVPEVILNKPARLTPAEYEVVKEHSALGAEILGASQAWLRHRAIVRHHHERIDGTGYPEGLKGESIPLEARIIAVAEAVSAMASDRPYRRAVSAEDILAEITEHAGTQFDEAVVKAFVRLVRREGAGVIVNAAAEVDERPARSLHVARGPLDTDPEPGVRLPIELPQRLG